MLIDKAKRLRLQAKRLRDKNDKYIAEHSDFELRKMRLSRFLPKGTALRLQNDTDVACCTRGIDLQLDLQKCHLYLKEKQRKTYPNFSPKQVGKQNYSVKVSFFGEGLDVDVAQILDSGDPNWNRTQGGITNTRR